MGKAAFGASPTSGQVSVTGSAAILVAAPSSGTGRCSSGIVLYALAANTQNVFVGPSGVTSSTGYAIEPGKALSLDVDDPSRIYAVSASGTQTITYIYV